MSSNKKPIFNDQEIGGNPFVGDLEIKVVERIIEGQFIKGDDGYVRAKVQLEYDIYAKLYTDAKRRKEINELPLRSKEILLWLLFSLSPGKDYVWINKRRYMKECNVSSIDTYKNALKELIKKKYLCYSVMPDVFWINPYKFFKGSRVNKFPDKVVLYKPKLEDREDDDF